MSPNQEESAKKDRYRFLGEACSNIVTDFKDGRPVLKNPPVALAPPPSPMLPSVTRDQTEGKPVISSAHDKVAHYRFALITALWKEITQKPGIKKHKIIKEFLRDYNSKFLLPNIFENLKKVSRSTIYRWIKAYREGGIEALVPQYRGPEASEITSAEKEFLRRKLLDQNKPTIGDTINKCKYLLGEMSSSSPAKLRRWVYDFRKNNYDIWTLEREGQKALNDKCVPYAEREWRDLQVGEAIVGDGLKLNFRVINPFSGKPCRATTVLFWDWKSAYPLGWEIMLTENIQCVVAALRNSIITLGKFPAHALLDNGKAFRASIFTKKFRFEETEIPGIFERLNIMPHFAIPYNAQSKPIERFFRTFNDWFERELPSYIGASINDKPAHMHRNEKRAQELHSNNDWVPTIPETMELIFRWREYYADQPLRARDGQRPGDIFANEKGPGVDPFALHFLMMTCKARMVHRNGITFNGWHWYHENLYGIKDYVLMFYSYYDLSQVYIFTMQQDGSPKEFLCVAKPVEKTKPFASDEFPEDMAAVQRVNSLKRKAINTTKRLADMLQSQKQVYIDWDRTLRDRPEVADAIKQIEEKSPKVVKISPFWDEPEVTTKESNQAPPPDENKLQIDPGTELAKPAIFVHPESGLTYPKENDHFDYMYERYDWYKKIEGQFPGTLNDKDWAHLRDFEATKLCRSLYNGSDDFPLKRTTSKQSVMNSESGKRAEEPQFQDDHDRYKWLMIQDQLTEEEIDFIWNHRKTNFFCQGEDYVDWGELTEKVRKGSEEDTELQPVALKT